MCAFLIKSNNKGCLGERKSNVYQYFSLYKSHNLDFIRNNIVAKLIATVLVFSFVILFSPVWHSTVTYLELLVAS